MDPNVENLRTLQTVSVNGTLSMANSKKWKFATSIAQYSNITTNGEYSGKFCNFSFPNKKILKNNQDCIAFIN